MNKHICPNCNIELDYKEGVHYSYINNRHYLADMHICKNCGYTLINRMYEKKIEPVELDVDNLKKRMEDYIKSI